jgi:hypothetical protein
MDVKPAFQYAHVINKTQKSAVEQSIKDTVLPANLKKLYGFRFIPVPGQPDQYRVEITRLDGGRFTLKEKSILYHYLFGVLVGAMYVR